MEFDDETLVVSAEVFINGCKTLLTLSTRGRIRWNGGQHHCLMIDDDILGFERKGTRLTVKAFVQRESSFCCGNRKQTRMDFIFESLDEESLHLWTEKSQEFLNSLRRPRKLFIIVNPFGGRKNALKIFRDEVEPLLVAANIAFTVQETKYKLHAKKIAQKLDISEYDGIVCVSGDGVLVEILNGLLKRLDWISAIKIPLGIIPAGSGNGMAKSLLHSIEESCSVSSAIFSIIRGHTRSLDVATLLQGEKSFSSLLMLSWGLVSDLDIESEKYRWMGSTRFSFYSVLRILNLRRYHGSISFVPSLGYEGYGELITPNDEWDAHLQMQSPSCVNDSDEALGYKGNSIDFEDSQWRIITGPFISVCLHNVPWASEDAMIAPHAEFSDGSLDLIIIKDCSKLELLEFMTKLKEGSHVKLPYVLYLKVKAFRLIPGSLTVDATRGGIIDVDGEVLARGKGTFRSNESDPMDYGPPLYVTVDKAMATIFSPRYVRSTHHFIY